MDNNCGNTVLITFYQMFDTTKMIELIRGLYDYVVVSKEYTKRGLVHYHALAHGIKGDKCKSIFNVRNTLRKRYKKTTLNPVRWTKYNMNIIQAMFIPGYEYATKDGEVIYNNIPGNYIHEKKLAHERVRKALGLGDPGRVPDLKGGEAISDRSPRSGTEANLKKI